MTTVWTHDYAHGQTYGWTATLPKIDEEPHTRLSHEACGGLGMTTVAMKALERLEKRDG